MKTTIAILATVLAAATGSASAASAPGVNLKITGGPENDVFRVTVSADGRYYEIESNVPLEADSSICSSSSSETSATFELHCRATAIAGFEISGGPGDDRIELASVPVPATIAGGPGSDTLIGGSGADRILGGAGRDVIEGRGGDDVLLGEEGGDRLRGGSGNDRLEGGAGNDQEFGGTGADTLNGGVGADLLSGGPGNDVLVGGPGLDTLLGGSGQNVLRQ